MHHTHEIVNIFIFFYHLQIHCFILSFDQAKSTSATKGSVDRGLTGGLAIILGEGEGEGEGGALEK